MEFVGYELGVVSLGVPERKGLLQASRRTNCRGKRGGHVCRSWNYLFSFSYLCLIPFFPRVYSKCTGYIFLLALGCLDVWLGYHKYFSSLTVS